MKISLPAGQHLQYSLRVNAETHDIISVYQTLGNKWFLLPCRVTPDTKHLIIMKFLHWPSLLRVFFLSPSYNTDISSLALGDGDEFSAQLSQVSVWL